MTQREDWLAVARGERSMPGEFQRFIAAWELIVLWHRSQQPKAMTDAQLKHALVRRLPELELDDDPEWLQRGRRLMRWNVMKMSGETYAGRDTSVLAPDDWQGVVDAIYTVRCNLLKGGKQPTNKNDLMLSADAADVTLYLATKLSA